jgi:Bacterial mobilisation protein (MobC)
MILARVVYHPPLHPPTAFAVTTSLHENTMARPQKQSDQHRQYRLSVRVTADELAVLLDRVREAGVDRSNYLRQAILVTRVSTSRTTKADPALIAELNRIGVNLNQMTRTTNGTGRVPPELIRLCEKIDRLVMKAIEQEVT